METFSVKFTTAGDRYDKECDWYITYQRIIGEFWDIL